MGAQLRSTPVLPMRLPFQQHQTHLFMLLIMFLRRLLNKESRNNQQPDPDAKQAVGDVEGRPVIAARIDVDEVSDRAIIKKPVVEISANAGGEKAKSDMNQFLHAPAE